MAMVNDLFPVGDWIRHHALRTWPVILFLLLIIVPSIALVVLGSPTKTTFDVAAWLFAAYFALAWLLLLGVIIRPDHVTRPMLLVLVAVALVTQVPLALALEQALHSSTTALGARTRPGRGQALQAVVAALTVPGGTGSTAGKLSMCNRR
jgi:hypothetical protein